MAFPVASGAPQYSGEFIPEIWSKRLNVKFYAQTVLWEISNHNWEGEIKNVGDKVQIRMRPDITTRVYSKNQKLEIEYPEENKITFPIEKGRYFNAACDDVDAHQADIGLLDGFAEEGGLQLKIDIDRLALADFYSDAHASNKGATAGVKSSRYNLGVSGTPIVLSETNVLKYIIQNGTVLSEQNVPSTQRWGVIPPFMAEMAVLSDLKNVSLTGDQVTPLRNGRIGRIGRFTLYESNQYTAVTDGNYSCYHLVFGHKSALTFAGQMTKMRKKEPSDYFGTFAQGLMVYDYKITKTESLNDFYVRPEAA